MSREVRWVPVALTEEPQSLPVVDFPAGVHSDSLYLTLAETIQENPGGRVRSLERRWRR